MFKPKYREKVYISARVSSCVQYALRFNLYSYQLYIAPKKLKIIIPPLPHLPHKMFKIVSNYNFTAIKLSQTCP